MSGNSIFLDTNILIYLLKGNEEIAKLLDQRIFIISFITELELLSFPDLETSERDKITALLSECYIVDVNKNIKESVLELRKKYKLKLPDSIICATARSLGLPFLTSDKKLIIVDELNVILYEL